TGNPVSIKIALSDAGWERLTPVKGYEKQENEHEVEREQRARLCHSSKHAHQDTRTYQSEGQFVQIRESGGGMASSHWGMYSRLPTLRVLTLRLRDVQFWLPIRNDRSWGRGIRTLRTPFLVNSFHRLI